MHTYKQPFTETSQNAIINAGGTSLCLISYTFWRPLNKNNSTFFLFPIYQSAASFRTLPGSMDGCVALTGCCVVSGHRRACFGQHLPRGHTENQQAQSQSAGDTWPALPPALPLPVPIPRSNTQTDGRPSGVKITCPCTDVEMNVVRMKGGGGMCSERDTQGMCLKIVSRFCSADSCV